MGNGGAWRRLLDCVLTTLLSRVGRATNQTPSGGRAVPPRLMTARSGRGNGQPKRVTA